MYLLRGKASFSLSCLSAPSLLETSNTSTSEPRRDLRFCATSGFRSAGRPLPPPANFRRRACRTRGNAGPRPAPFLLSWRASRAPIKPRRLVNRLAGGSFPSWLAGGGQREAHWRRRRRWWGGGFPTSRGVAIPSHTTRCCSLLPSERAGAVGHCLFSSPPAGPLQNLGSSQSSHPAERRGGLSRSLLLPSLCGSANTPRAPPARPLPPSAACFWFGMFLTSTACKSPPRPRSGEKAPGGSCCCFFKP